MEKKDKNKKIISLGIVLFIVMLLVSGGSYAYLSWATATSERTNVALTITAPDMTATLTGYTQTISNLAPVSSCTDSTYAIKKELTLTYENLSTNAGEILGTLSIENFTSPNGTPDSDDLSHLHYAVTTSDTNCTTDAVEGMSGTFKSTTGSLFSSQKLVGPIPAGTTETSSTYYLWVWLDLDYTHQNIGSGVTNDPMQNISFTLVWSGEIKNDLEVTSSTTSGPETPDLDTGMIPVTIANDGTVTTVAENDSNWYDYSEQKWANVVLVKESGTQSRSYYKSNTGVTVNQNDILAYYVWIPRYKYKIWSTTTGSTPQTIDIEFESESAETVLGTTIDSWRTHPAFIWDGETIAGIWVGKFETSTETTSTCYTSASYDNCNNTDQPPRILPNVHPLRIQSVSNQFATALKFAGGTLSGSNVTFVGSSTYGLTTNTDSHMMKNSEWGAVAYLSHSQYGINTEIRINNNSSYTTGCGASEENSDNSTLCQISYGGASSYPQSTTGNITGIFDMSGGTNEYVMGHYYDLSWDSSGFTTLPASKYHDEYTTDNPLTACDGGVCYGHALSETTGWYDDDQEDFVYSFFTWLIRGDDCFDGGVWAFSVVDGAADGYLFYSFRSVAIVVKG